MRPVDTVESSYHQQIQEIPELIHKTLPCSKKKMDYCKLSPESVAQIADAVTEGTERANTSLSRFQFGLAILGGITSAVAILAAVHQVWQWYRGKLDALATAMRDLRAANSRADRLAGENNALRAENDRLRTDLSVERELKDITKTGNSGNVTAGGTIAALVGSTS